MADLTITAANVKQGSNALTTDGLAGAVISAGQAVTRSVTGRFVLSDNDAPNLKQVDGIALNGAADGQPLRVQTGGDLTLGATLTAGTAYYLSGTPGGICPVGDVTTGDDVILIGIARSTSVIALRITDVDVTL